MLYMRQKRAQRRSAQTSLEKKNDNGLEWSRVEDDGGTSICCSSSSSSVIILDTSQENQPYAIIGFVGSFPYDNNCIRCQVLRTRFTLTPKTKNRTVHSIQSVAAIMTRVVTRTEDNRAGNFFIMAAVAGSVITGQHNDHSRGEEQTTCLVEADTSKANWKFSPLGDS